MAEINEIFDSGEAKKILEVGKSLGKTDDALIKITEDMEKFIKVLNESDISLKDLVKIQDSLAKSTDTLNKANKKLSDEEKKLREIEKEAIKNQKEREKAAAQLEKQRQRGLAQLAKQEAKERELIVALELEVKTEKDAIRQNKALREVRRQVDSTTEEGIKKVEELNDRIDKNTQFLKGNADSYVQQKMNIGNYKDDIVAAAKEVEIFGVSINKVTGFLSSGAGVVTAITATVVGLGKAYASSARGAEDMARASDRLNSIAKSLGNTLADATGETGFFDTLVRDLQAGFLGLASTMQSDVQVGILSTIRQLEILEADQERQKKSQLDRAEVLRQIRDEERNSFEERKAANDELGQIINQRENDTVAFQQKILDNYKTLLVFDEGNLEIQRAIKQIEFEIADAREEAQGFRSEQLMNDLALSREYYENQIELSTLAIEGEIARNGESFELRKKLIENTRELELKAAGENEQLQEIANIKAENAMIELHNKYREVKIAEFKFDEEISEEKLDLVDDALSKEVDATIEATNKIIAERDRLAEYDEELEERKRQAKYQTLDAIRFIFGEETAIGKAATAIQQAEAIKQNLISLGVITAKSAEGQAKSAAAAPFPFNIPLIAGSIAQFISILSLFRSSESVAGFATGTENAPGRFVAGEKGRELMMLKTGEIIMVDRPTYFEGNQFKGATIKSNPETEKIISKAQKSGNFVFDDRGLKNEMIAVRRAIEKKPVNITDNRGTIIGKQSGNHREIYLSKLRNGR